MNKKELLNLISSAESSVIEFKQSFSKESIETLVAFSNFRGGKLLVGIGDSGNILGVNLQKETLKNWLNEIKTKTQPFLMPDVETIIIENKTIVIFDVKEFPLKPVAFNAKVFLRKENSNHKCSVEESSEIYLRTKRSSWDFYPNKEFIVRDLDDKKIKKVMSLIENNISISLGTKESFLRKYDLIVEEDNILYPTHAAVLLFSKKPLRETDIQIGLFQDEISIKKNKIIRNDLVSEVEEVLDFIKAYILKEFIITGNPYREERWQYPLEAIRELVINAIIHRDYRGVHSQFKIFPEMIELWNSGKIPIDLTIKDILDGKKRSEPRNRLVAEIFRDAGLIERYGSGVKRVREQLKDYGLIDLNVRSLQSGFNVEVFAEKISGGLSGGLSAALNDLFDYISTNPNVQAQKISEDLSRPIDTVDKQIKKLIDKNLIKREGSKKTGGYWVIKQ